MILDLLELQYVSTKILMHFSFVDKIRVVIILTIFFNIDYFSFKNTSADFVGNSYESINMFDLSFNLKNNY